MSRPGRASCRPPVEWSETRFRLVRNTHDVVLVRHLRPRSNVAGNITRNNVFAVMGLNAFDGGDNSFRGS